LDPVAGDELLGLLRRLNEEWGVTVILAEHRLERCLGAADRVVALERGRITFSGPPAEFCGWAAAQDPAVATSATRVLHEVAPELAGAAITVKQARAALEQRGLLRDASPGSATLSRAALPAASDAGLPRPLETPGAPARRRLARRATRGVPPAGTAVRATGVWRELGSGQTLLRGIDLSLAPGEAVALMGRNGAGKTTLLRLLAGLDRPDRGRVEAAGRVALLLQRSSDHLLHERVGDELPDGVTAASIGLGDDPAILDRHPRDLSGGQGQLLAAAVVAGASAPAVLCLDEPTRGLDRLHRAELAAELQRRRAEGTATLVATHDPEFAATVADRVILLGQGAVLADGPAAEILEGGWYFATELARILQTPGVVTPSQASALLARRAQLLDAAQNPQEPQS
ncbi:MAG: ATP-binding cassette domain-containing protein, partial [Solirubrobacteraceae bacterium]|nr:ATP-binding cassette domain-containing protein [Solirubrobacteraceae bacterium]